MGDDCFSLREAVRLQVDLAQTFSSATLSTLWLTRMQLSLTRCLRDQKRVAEAAEVYEDAIKRLQNLHGERGVQSSGWGMIMSSWMRA